ncbi:MAG: potassium-transporting ATPase subunit KdpA, partial [Parachlamydiaceae bacterium]
MSFLDLLEPLFLIAILICLIPILGSYMVKVFSEKRTWMHGLLGWLELSCYRIAGINPASEMTWWIYAKTL